MLNNRKSKNRLILVAITFGFASSLVDPGQANAQGTQGQNAVYDSSAANVIGSSSFIDASMFLPPNGTQATDLCGAIYFAFTRTSPPYPPSGTVIDARGISGSALTCASNTSPWFKSSTGYVNKPSVILLPAGTINTPIAWVLPNNTKLIGTAKAVALWARTTMSSKPRSYPQPASAGQSYSSEIRIVPHLAAREFPWSI